MQTNNQYYKSICESYGITVDSGIHTNNYYLKKIATKICGSYTGTHCNGKYLKDIAEELSETTYTGHHFNNFYLEKICTALTGYDYNTQYDNYFLEVWANSVQALKTPTTLQILPTLLVYSDEFKVEGTLESSDLGETISNAPIRLVWTVNGVEHTATAYTDSNGKVTFYRDAPTTITQYSFQLFYDGDVEYKSSHSSVMNKTPQQETTILTVDYPVDGGSVSSSSITVTGTLFDDDGTPLEGETIEFSRKAISAGHEMYIYDGETSVDSNGEFEYTFSEEFELGNNGIWVTFYQTQYYTYSSKNIEFNRVSFDDFSFTADKGILSFADSEQSELKVQLLNNGSIASFSGVEVKLYKDSVLWDTLYTDSTGKVTKTYVSQGIGDVEFEAQVMINGSFVSETYEVHDYIKYIASGSHTFSSSSMTFYELFDANGIGDCEISVKLKSANQNGFSLDYRKSNSDVNNTSLERVGVDGANNLFVTALNSGGSGTPSYPSKSYSTNTDLNCVIHRENGTTTMTVGTNSYNYTSIADLRYIGIMNWNNAKTVTYTDFIVKPL